MKGKIRILGHIGLALLLLSALMLALAPVAQAASSVSSVWMEFAAAGNNINTNALYTIHFTTSSALSRGVDTITVIFPDGTDTTMGPTLPRIVMILSLAAQSLLRLTTLLTRRVTL